MFAWGTILLRAQRGLDGDQVRFGGGAFQWVASFAPGFQAAL